MADSWCAYSENKASTDLKRAHSVLEDILVYVNYELLTTFIEHQDRSRH